MEEKKTKKKTENAEVQEPEITETVQEESTSGDKLKEEVEKMKEIAMRTQADFDNYRKRNADAVIKARADGKADAITEFLPVLDNFERAISVIADESAKEGVEKIRKQFVHTLETLGVKEIDASGDFDPAKHNAVLSEEKEGVPAGKILEVLQKGYETESRVIRYAMVKVSC